MGKVNGVPYDDTKLGMGYHEIDDGRVQLATSTKCSWHNLQSWVGLDTFPFTGNEPSRWFCDHTGSGGGVGTIWVYKPDTRGVRGFNGGLSQGYPLRKNVVVSLFSSNTEKM